MAQAINGIGTAFYGQREFRADGSYITTEWFILCFVPILPLRSIRVIRNPSADTNLVVYTSESFHVLETTRPNLKQVLATYGFALFCAFWLVFVFWLLVVRLSPDWQRYGTPLVFGAVFLAAAPFFIPLLWRRSSKFRVSPRSPVPPPLPQELNTTPSRSPRH